MKVFDIADVFGLAVLAVEEDGYLEYLDLRPFEYRTRCDDREGEFKGVLHDPVNCPISRTSLSTFVSVFSSAVSSTMWRMFWAMLTS